MTYSNLRVRERIAEDIRRIERDLDWYERNGGTEAYAEHMQTLAARKERLLAQAQHYDQEQAAGYGKPATRRWGK
jgi:hypothetical protein